MLTIGMCISVRCLWFVFSRAVSVWHETVPAQATPHNGHWAVQPILCSSIAMIGLTMNHFNSKSITFLLNGLQENIIILIWFDEIYLENYLWNLLEVNYAWRINSNDQINGKVCFSLFQIAKLFCILFWHFYYII